jgi:hypothetical protein
MDGICWVSPIKAARCFDLNPRWYTNEKVPFIVWLQAASGSIGRGKLQSLVWERQAPKTHKVEGVPQAIAVILLDL